jgi:hypothetical protein
MVFAKVLSRERTSHLSLNFSDIVRCMRYIIAEIFRRKFLVEAFFIISGDRLKIQLNDHNLREKM